MLISNKSMCIYYEGKNLFLQNILEFSFINLKLKY